MKTWQFRTLLTALTVLLAAPRISAEPYHSARHGYLLEAPAGWEEIPTDVLSELVAVMKDPSSAITIRYDAGFQRGGAEQWLEYPYVIVQVLPYSDMGLRRQPTDAEIEQIVSAMAGTNAADVEENFSEEGRSAVGNLQFGQPAFDGRRRIVTVDSNGHVAGVGIVRCRSVGHFGRESLVQVICYAPESEWNEHAEVFDAVIGSFRFDPGARYSEIAAPASREAAFGEAAVRLAGCALALAVLLSIVRSGMRQGRGGKAATAVDA